MLHQELEDGLDSNWMREAKDKLTESLPGLEASSARAECLLETLVGTICDGWIDNQNETGFQASPETTDAVRALDDFLSGGKQSPAVNLAGSLLSGRHNGDGDCEELGQSTRNGTKGQFSGG